MVERPLDVVVKIGSYLEQGSCVVNAKISECKVYCDVGGNSYIHNLSGVDFNYLIHALSLLDVEFRVS